MRGKLIALMAAMLAIATSAEANGLAGGMFQLDPVKRLLVKSELTDAQAPLVGSAEVDPQRLNPGRALLLSAIIPGAGQLSIGSKWRAALFFTIEAAAWGSAIYFYNQGMDKDREFKRFADDHFAEQDYRNVEFDLARNPAFGDSGAFVGTMEEWIEQTWEVKIHFLPSQGFTHEMPTEAQRRANKSHDQQYYEMIGKYIRQFGFGWDDRVGDDPGTPWFDGRSLHSEIYMDMRYDSNKMLDYHSYALQAALLNHVAAALDASFTVRALKRKALAEVGVRTIKFDDHYANVAGLHFQW